MSRENRKDIRRPLHAPGFIYTGDGWPRATCAVSRAMENCPLGVTRNCPLLGITEERANGRGANHGNPVVERSTGAGDEDAGRCGGDVAAEGVRVGCKADCASSGV